MEVQSTVLHDAMFPMLEHLLTKAHRRVGLYEVKDHGEQNTTTPRDFRNCLGVSHTLDVRIDIFRSLIEEKVRTKWPGAHLKSDIHSVIQEYSLTALMCGSFVEDANSIGDVNMEEDHDSIVMIGAITKRQRVHQFEVQQMCKKIGVLPLPMQKEYFGEDSEHSVFLSDKSSRILLTIPYNNILPGDVAAGVVCAIKGRVKQRQFMLEDVIFPTGIEPIWPQVSKFHNIEMVFISGLHIGKIADDFVHRNLLMEYLQGITGCPAEQEHIVRRKTRAFIIGNTFYRNRKKHLNDTENLTAQVETAKLVDEFISHLSDTMEVFLIPGENDPTTTPILPQPPIHSMILPMSNQHRNFRKLSNPANVKVSVTNPLSTDPLISVIEGECMHLILNSGKNITDSMNSCGIQCPLTMAKKLLEWSHLNPTSQQIIPLRSGSSEECFCLQGRLPNLFVLGNQRNFGVEYWNGVKIISVPDFEKTATIALLNFELDVLPMSFNILL